MDARCRIELFGQMRLVQEDRTITRFRTHKAAHLLAYLALHLDQSHARERLIELFWPEAEMEVGRANLSNALSSLRRQIEPPGVAAGSVLVADRQNVR
jgi:DNA-binding SARP family transcriptional activator